MKSSPKCVIASTVLLLLVADNTWLASAFAPTAVINKHVTRSHQVTLKYRKLEQDDVAVDSSAIRKIQVRTPPGFDLESSLEEDPSVNVDPVSQQASTKPTSIRSGKPSAVNRNLIKALLLNQGLVLAISSFITFAVFFVTDGFSAFGQLGDLLNWSGSGQNDILNDFVNPFQSNNPIIVGLLASIPIIAFGYAIEQSDNRDVANLNFSTITMVMTLFGRRSVPPPLFLPKKLQSKAADLPTTTTAEAFIQSLRLALVTGVCEEIVFRYQIPGMLHHVLFTGGSWTGPLFGSAALFALGHAQGGANKWMENGVTMTLQFINGLAFGMIYILSGGNIVPAIVAHAAYDTFVLFETWYSANGQVEYADQMATDKNNDDDDTNLRQLDARIIPTVKRLFYTFDYDKNRSLSKSEVRKGFSYLALEKFGTPPPQEQIDALFDKYITHDDTKSNNKKAPDDRLTLTDFYRLYSESMPVGRRSVTSKR